MGISRTTPMFCNSVCIEKCLRNFRKNVNDVIIDIVDNVIASG
jgi:hypothetical protein